MNDNLIVCPQGNPELFWQFPVITEKYCLNKLSNSRTPYIYVAFPFATMIDKSLVPMQELAALGIAIKEKLKDNPGLKVVTACQHIHFRNIILILKMLGITDIYVSHKPRAVSTIESIKLHGLPLYPVNMFDSSRRIGVPDENLARPRSLLFSFIGAYMRHYLHPIRKTILSWPQSADGTYIIRDTKIWHFEKQVYDGQVRGKNITVTEKDKQALETKEYNEVLANSIFSLCPVGAGPNTIRLWESICIGSIPVIIADEFNIRDCVPSEYHNTESGRSFFIELPYVSPHLKNVKALEEYLRKFSEADIMDMRKGCLRLGEYLRETFIGPL